MKPDATAPLPCVDVASLQKADYLSYEQFSMAYRVARKTIANWATKGNLPIAYMNPKTRSSPMIVMKEIRRMLALQPVNSSFMEIMVKLEIEAQARHLIANAVESRKV